MNAQPDRLFIARLEDMLGQCGRYSAPVFSSFLDERQCAETEIWLRANAGDCGYLLWGGYPDARRKMLAVFPEYLRGGALPSPTGRRIPSPTAISSAR